MLIGLVRRADAQAGARHTLSDRRSELSWTWELAMRAELAGLVLHGHLTHAAQLNFSLSMLPETLHSQLGLL